MRLGAYYLAATLCLIELAGCAGLAGQAPPGPRPVPEAWRPAPVLRAQVQPSGSGEIVLDTADGLSPDEAALMALDQNPRLRALRAERGIARAEVLAAGILPNPRLDGSLEAPTSGKEATVLGYGVGLSWNVTPLISRGARIAAAKDSLEAVDLDVAWQEWQVAQGARLHAIRSIYLNRRSRLAGKIEKTWRERLSGLKRAVANKAVTALRVANAERFLAEAQVRRLDIEQRLAAERVALNQAIGLDARAAPLVDGSWTPSATVPSTKSLLEGLPRRRLDLIALQHAQRSHDHALRAAVLARFPAVDIGVHAGRDVDRVGAAGAGLSFEIPFFDRNQGNVARQRAGRAEVEAEYDARLTTARAKVVRLTEAITLVRQQLAAAAKAAAAAVRVAELARAAASGGALSLLVRAEIQERAYAARLRKLEIEQSLAELRVALVIAAGTELH